MTSQWRWSYLSGNKKVCGAGAKALGERKGLTMKERLQKCQQTERQRITFGKVSLIHTPMLAAAAIVVKTTHCHLHGRKTVPPRCLLQLISLYISPVTLWLHMLSATPLPAIS